METVSEQAQDAEAYDWLPAQVVIGWGGDVTAVWYRPAVGRRGFLEGRLISSRRTGPGVWSVPAPVSAPFELNEQSFDVAAGADGRVSVVWSARAGGSQEVLEAHRGRGLWSAPVRVGSGSMPQVAVDGAGDTSVVWFGPSPRVASRPAGGPWGRPTVFADNGDDFATDIVTNRAGDTVAMWRQVSGPVRGAGAVFRGRDATAWPPIEDVLSPSFDHNGPALVIRPDGQVLAAWTLPRDVVWTGRSRAEGWEPLQRIEGRVGYMEEYGRLDLSVNRYGQALAVWLTDVDTWTARYAPERGLVNPVRLTTRRDFFRSAGPPLLTASGTAVVVGEVFDDKGPRFAYRWQEPGGAWGLERRNRVEDVIAVGARGSRLAAMVSDDGLHVAMLDVRQ